MNKWNKVKVYKEALKLIKQYGELPGNKKLKTLGRIDFLMAVRRHYNGQMTQLRIDLGIKSKFKPPNYWTRERVIMETKKIIESEGKMPSQKRLRELGYSTINLKARKYYGGLIGLAKACDISSDNLLTEFKYWQDIENVKKELNLIEENLGRFPTTSDLKLIGKSGLLGAISKYYGGIKNLRIKLNIINNYPIAKDGHACDSYSEVIVDDFLYANQIEHSRDIQFDFGIIKCRPDFILCNGYLIEVLMADYNKKGHKGVYAYYVKKYLSKKKAYALNNLKVIEIFPEELINRDLLDKKLILIAKLSQAKSPYKLKDFSNISFFDKKSPGFWNDEENLRNELFPLIEKYGHIPTIKELREIGRNDIEGAIVNVYGSYRNVSKALGISYDDLIKPQRYWQDIENIKEELKPIIKKYGFIPSRALLMKEGKRDIVSAVDTYKGSFKNIAKLVGVDYKPAKKTNRHWLTEENIKKELAEIIKKSGRFPTASDLRILKKHGLLKGILNIYGSFQNGAIQLGFKSPENKSKGYWKILLNVLNEMDFFFAKYGIIPSCKIIEKEKSMLMYSIKNYHGGMEKVRNEYHKIRNI